IGSTACELQLCLLTNPHIVVAKKGTEIMSGRLAEIGRQQFARFFPRGIRSPRFNVQFPYASTVLRLPPDNPISDVHSTVRTEFYTGCEYSLQHLLVSNK